MFREGRQLTQDTSATSQETNESVDGAAVVAAGCPVAPAGYEMPAQPLGPDSLTWKYFGRWTGMLRQPRPRLGLGPKSPIAENAEVAYRNGIGCVIETQPL